MNNLNPLTQSPSEKKESKFDKNAKSQSTLQKVNYLKIQIDQNKLQVILDESITSNHYNSEIDVVSYLGNIFSEFTQFGLFEYDNSQPLNHKCIYNFEGIEESISVDNVLQKKYPRSVFIKFCASEIERKAIEKYLQQAKKIINYIKQNINGDFENEEDLIYQNTVDWIIKNNLN